MKKISKVLSVVLAMVVLAVALVGCGSKKLDMSKVKGDWKVKTINGTAIETYAENAGVSTDAFAMAVTVDDKTIKMTGLNGTQTYDIDVKSNGFEVMQDKEVLFSVEYKDDTLTFSMQAEEKVTYVLEKGTYTFAPAADDADTEEGGEAEGSEDVEEEE